MHSRSVAAVAAFFLAHAVTTASAAQPLAQASFEQLVHEDAGSLDGIHGALFEPAADSRAFTGGAWAMGLPAGSARLFADIQADRRKDWGDSIEWRRAFDVRKDWGPPPKAGVFSPDFAWHGQRHQWFLKRPVSAIPEPSALALLLAGAAVVGLTRRREPRPRGG